MYSNLEILHVTLLLDVGKLFNLCDRSSRGRSRFDTDLDDAFIPPRVLTLKINRPETVPGRFTKTKISDASTNRAMTQNAEDKEETADHQNDKDMDESNGVTRGKSGNFFVNPG